MHSRPWLAMASPSVRVFVLCDARSGVQFDASGEPLGLDSAVIPDLDVMLATARRHRIGLMPVLLDFHFCGAKRFVNGVQLGGHSRLIADPELGTAFIDRVLRPIVERYADDETVVAWDLINEPEWCLRGSRLFRRSTVSFDAMQQFLGEAVRCVKRTASQPVTIGCAGTWRLDLVRPLGLDFYQVHWYDKFGWPALARPVAELGLNDRPVILGEFAGRSTRVPDVLDAAKRAGYEGALVWSMLADDKHSAYPPALGEWSRTRGLPAIAPTVPDRLIVPPGMPGPGRAPAIRRRIRRTASRTSACPAAGRCTRIAGGSPRRFSWMSRIE